MLSLLKLVTVSLLSAVGAFAAVNQLQQISSFGTNPTNVRMYLYRPPNVVANPALIVAMHYCTGTAQAYFSGTQYANLADAQRTFIVLYPHAPDSGGCWDVHTNATFTHNAGGDSLGIASAVRYAIANYGVDANRVFATGTSSGAMMTNVLAGAYPDLFKAGAAFAGVPYACFSGAGMWNNECAGGTKSLSAQAWVRNFFPTWSLNVGQFLIRCVYFRVTSFARDTLDTLESVPGCRSGTEPGALLSPFIYSLPYTIAQRNFQRYHPQLPQPR
jgi:acetylxylan esterase